MLAVSLGFFFRNIFGKRFGMKQYLQHLNTTDPHIESPLNSQCDKALAFSYPQRTGLLTSLQNAEALVFVSSVYH